jgi:hypothetical protein
MSHYDKEIGIFVFNGEADDVAFRFMWTCLMDFSWRGMIETIWRIITKRPPERYFTDWKEDKVNHNKECPFLKGEPVCTCGHLQRYS